MASSLARASLAVGTVVGCRPALLPSSSVGGLCADVEAAAAAASAALSCSGKSTFTVVVVAGFGREAAVGDFGSSSKRSTWATCNMFQKVVHAAHRSRALRPASCKLQ